MKIQHIHFFLALLFSAVTLASHVGYSIGAGTRPLSYVSVGLTLRIPAAYQTINQPDVISGLAQLVLGDVYSLASDAWMFPPQTSYFQYASEGTDKFVTVGALLAYTSIGISEVIDVGELLASTFGIPFLGNLGNLANLGTKRDLKVGGSELLDMLLAGREEEVANILTKREATCASYTDLTPYITEDTEQTSDTFGFCST